MRNCVIIFFILANGWLHAQPRVKPLVFAHNDYQQSKPFYAAYDLKVSYIEVDVFLRDGALCVAHASDEISDKKVLQSMYLMPLEEKIKLHPRYAYEDSTANLTLMIDIKTEGTSTLQALEKLLKQYPVLIACKTLQILISGNVPDPSTWSTYSDFIHFDGRPGVLYTADQRERVGLISNDFRVCSSWNGLGNIPPEERVKLSAVIKEVHNQGKKIRFWGTPDNENTWRQLLEIKVDVLNTDSVDDLSRFIQATMK
jgi:alkaline phosphatase